MSDQEKYLHEHRAWNWQWPNERNCWATKTTRRGPSMPYSGPSKGIVARRATRASKKRTGRRAH